ncbi:MAG: DUF3108 domain-containing protein [Saprospiraceae bacterium]|nr:DUF3108 domain-containing protein [Saprospiraceae bacterium]HRG67976.1 DUF3108 domain-containing protein [Saprospiraceae bacterium]
MKLRIIISLFVFSAIGFWSFRPSPDTSGFAFSTGEKLVYKVFYNWNFVWLSAGEVIFEIKDEPDAYHIEVTGKTYASYEWFYKVRDKYHSYIDKTTGLPKLYIREIHQGNYRHYEKIVFDYPNHKAYSSTGRSFNKTKTTEIDLDGNYYDMISSMYYLRNIDLKSFQDTKSTAFKIILDNTKYELNLKYQKEDSDFKVKESGTYKTIHAIGDVISGNVFDAGVQMNFWVANDSNKLPVLMESPLVVGSVKGILASYENLKYPFSAKLK